MKQEQPKFISEPTNVEYHQFERPPIKGFPELKWRGKRPFTSTQYYPAQLKEVHGEEKNGWLNKIFWGDNLQVMSHLLKEFRGQVDLAYLDPPFDSKAEYKKKIELRGKSVTNDQSSFEEKQYTDIWSNDEYLQFMYERLILIRELLSDAGSIFVHVDYRKAAHIKCILDEVFGDKQFRNEIIWFYPKGGDADKQFNKKHDNIFWYSKGPSWTFNYTELLIPYTDKQIARFKETDENGIKFYWNTNPRGEKVKTYLHKAGIGEYDVWTIPIDALLSQRLGYPTPKPPKLLERIILASSKPSHLVFDCFMGSGTTQAVAMKFGRRFIGADINLGAIQTTTKRLLGIAQSLNSKLDRDNYYTGFEVYNVNHYDVFRNPAEAKDLLIKALEIHPLPGNSIYDGEKDGRLVKIMPVNRIATRADLNELISNLDYNTFEKLNQRNPGKPVADILLVCMGHEPDLKASLLSEVKKSGFTINVEVVDILRDKSNLEFKRDSEANIKIDKGIVLVKSFYPMNLLQKLSLDKKDVKDWRELVESIMLDFNYDGAVLTPSVSDIPEDGELVAGSYPIPKGASAIRVKITDLLSESLEVTLNG